MKDTNKQTSRDGGENRSVAMNIFAILGFIAILIAGLWATIQLLQQVTNSSFDFLKPNVSLPGFNTDADNIIITSTKDPVQNSAPTDITWKLGEKISQDGLFSISYACRKGLYMKVQRGGENGEFITIPCNAPYSGVDFSKNSISVVPVIGKILKKEGKDLYMPYAIAYNTKDGKEYIANGKILIAVNSTGNNPTDNRSNITKNKVVKNKVVKRTPGQVLKKTIPIRTNDSHGTVDLTIKILSADPLLNDKVSVRLLVSNLGTKMVNGWKFTATLPTTPVYTYTSDPQGPLYAGESAEIVMIFDKFTAKNKSLFITVDATNEIPETLETNNSAWKQVTINQ